MTPTEPGFYEGILDHISDGVYFVDRERRILYWNQGATRLTGYKPEEIVGRYCQDDILCHVDAAGRRLCQDGCPLTASVNDGRPHEAQVFLRHKQGRRVPVSVRVQPVRAADGSIIGAVEIFGDNSVRQAAQRRTQEMERLAFLDQVTGLPNRRYLEMSVQTSLREYRVHKDPFGVLMMDFDHFKTINDRFGHSIGDHALQEVAKTLLGVLRTTDILGRWGGDEFLAVVRHMTGETLRVVAERCCVLVSHTTFANSDGVQVSLSVSIGATLALPDDTAEQLVQRADDLMYQSKARGRSCASIQNNGP